MFIDGQKYGYSSWRRDKPEYNGTAICWSVGYDFTPWSIVLLALAYPVSSDHSSELQ